jgi:hypothetical protein
MFTGRIAKVVTAVAVLVGLAALTGSTVLTFVGGSEYAKFALAMVFFVAALTASYWFVVYGPGGRQ